MLYRDSYGKLREVRRDMFINDREYYKKVFSLNSGIVKTCDDKTTILNIVIRKSK